MQYSLLGRAACILFAFIALLSMSSLEAGNSIATAIALDLNQQIVLGGFANNAANTTTDFALARLNADGTLDTTFNPGGLQQGRVTLDIQGTNDAISSIAIDQNNKIVAAGVSSIGFQTEFAIACFNTDGSLDTTFNADGFLGGIPGVVLVRISQLSDVATSVALDSQGRIVVVGTTDNGFNTDIAVVRLTSDGRLDSTFNPQSQRPGIATFDINGGNDNATSVDIDAADNIYIGGTTRNGFENDFLVMKLNVDGTLDTTFNQFSLNPGIAFEGIGTNSNSVAFALKLDSNNNIVLGGSTSDGITTTFALMRFTPEGMLDITFNSQGTGGTPPGIVVTNAAFASAPSSITLTQLGSNAILGLAFDLNDQIIATGFSNSGANTTFATARYNVDGTLDGTFNLNGPLPGVVITDLVQPTVFSFNDNNANAVVVDAQNNIIVTGFSRLNSQNNFTTINYLPTGDINTAFGPLETVPGVVLTFFGTQQNLLGNGIPLFLGGGTAGVSPTFLEGLRYPVTPIVPSIVSEGPILSNDYQPTLGGLASPNAIITLYVNDIPLTTVQAGMTGAWTATLPPLLDGTYAVTAVATDPITGLSLASLSQSLTIITQAPEPPLIELPEFRQTVTNSRVLIRGRAQPDTRVTLFLGDGAIGQANVNQVGVWQFTTATLKDGFYPLFAITVDKAGNGSVPSELVLFTVDTGTERAPTITSPQQKFISTKTSIDVTGEARPGSLVNLYFENKLLKAIKATSEGAWSHTLSGLSEGAHQIYATTADKKLSSEVITFTVDTKQQRRVRTAQPVVTKGVINGVAEPGGIITLYLDAKPLGKTVADLQGGWSYTPGRDQKIAPGKHLLKVSVADKAGKISSIVDQEIVL